MYYFASLCRYLNKLHQNYAATVEAREQAVTFKASDDAQKRLAAALAKLKADDAEALNLFKIEVTGDLSSLRSNNNQRTVNRIENNDLNLLSALQLIRHVPDELALAARRCLSESRICQLALRNIILNSWSDEPGYRLPPMIDDVTLPMPVQNVERIISKIEAYCKSVYDPDVGRKQKIYDDEAAFLRNEIALADKEIGAFRYCVSREAKY